MRGLLIFLLLLSFSSCALMHPSEEKKQLRAEKVRMKKEKKRLKMLSQVRTMLISDPFALREALLADSGWNEIARIREVDTIYIHSDSIQVEFKYIRDSNKDKQVIDSLLAKFSQIGAIFDSIQEKDLRKEVQKIIERSFPDTTYTYEDSLFKVTITLKEGKIFGKTIRKAIRKPYEKAVANISIAARKEEEESIYHNEWFWVSIALFLLLLGSLLLLLLTLLRRKENHETIT